MSRAQRRALKRAMKHWQPVTVLLGEETFVIDTDVPLRVVADEWFLENVFLADEVPPASEWQRLVRILLGEQSERFLALKPSAQDIRALWEGFAREFALSTKRSS